MSIAALLQSTFGVARRLWPAAVLAVALGATIYATRIAYDDANAAAIREMRFAADEIRHRIEDRLQRQEDILLAGAGLFDASQQVSRDEWRSFVKRQEVAKRLGGVLGLGWAVGIPVDGLARHIEEVRSEGFPNYRVWPEGARERYSAILYLEPFAGRNLRAHGYDMLSESVRRAAAERARDDGVPALSGKVVLVQETDDDVQPGTLMYVPVYQRGMPTSSVEERRAAFRGWVYSPYRMRDLMHGILGGWESLEGKRLRLEVYDGLAPTPASLLYGSHPAGHRALVASALSVEAVIIFGGRPWTVRFSPLDAQRLDLGRMWLSLAGGTTASLLLFALSVAILRTQSRALQMAERMTSELRESEARFRTMADTAPVLVWRSGTDGRCDYFNQIWLEFTGRTMDQEIGDGWAEGVHPDDMDRCLDIYRTAFQACLPFSMEYRLRRADGVYRWMMDHGVPRVRSDGAFAGFIGSLIDISVMKQTEADLHDALREKETLIKEVHHRVKNNLQVMISLLALQGEQVGDSRSKGALMDSAERLRSMALVHEQLYGSHDLARIDIARYLSDLTLGLRAVFGARDSVVVEVGAEQVWLGVDTAIPCGLIVNELVSNALKYAFPAGRAGRVGVVFEAAATPDGARRVVLRVSDDGVGLPEGLDAARTPSLGLRLVHILARQLGGTVTVSRGEGTRFEIAFREKAVAVATDGRSSSMGRQPEDGRSRPA